MQIILSYLFLCLSTVLYSSPSDITIKVYASESPLSYASIKVKNGSSYIVDENGSVVVDKLTFKLGDSLFVKHIGFKPKTVCINEEILTKDVLNIFLEKEYYKLEEVVVTSKFDAHKFFNKKKKNILIAYLGNVEADFDYRRTTNIKGKGSFLYDCIEEPKILCIEPKCFGDEKFVKLLSRGIKTNHIVAGFICSRKRRKMFQCSYKGKKQGFMTWEFRAKEKFKKYLLEAPHYSHDLTCIVKLNKKGVITNIETQLLKKGEVLDLYTQKTKYKFFKGRLIAESSEVELISNDITKTDRFFVTFEYYRK